MYFVSPVFDFYTGYLIINQGQNKATGIDALLEGKLKHNSVTRALSEKDYRAKDLWIALKSLPDR